MSGPDHIELIARALIVSKGQLLLTRWLAKQVLFLPGGHIEPGESAEAGLRRELMEELGVVPQSVELCGLIEQLWYQDSVTKHELNLVFLVEGHGFDSRVPVPSLEPEFAFAWVPLVALDPVPLKPDRLKTLIPQWLADSPRQLPFVSLGFD